MHKLEMHNLEPPFEVLVSTDIHLTSFSNLYIRHPACESHYMYIFIRFQSYTTTVDLATGRNVSYKDYWS